MIQKVQAYIIRKNKEPEVLIFQHDLTKIFQVIRGTLQPLENPETAVIREMAEESGLKSAIVIKKLGEADIEVPGGPTRSGPLELQRHHAYLLQISSQSPDCWTHIASGSVEEEGVKFHFAWHPIDRRLLDLFAMVEMKHFIFPLIEAVR